MFIVAHTVRLGWEFSTNRAFNFIECVHVGQCQVSFPCAKGSSDTPKSSEYRKIIHQIITTQIDFIYIPIYSFYSLASVPATQSHRISDSTRWECEHWTVTAFDELSEPISIRPDKFAFGTVLVNDHEKWKSKPFQSHNLKRNNKIHKYTNLPELFMRSIDMHLWMKFNFNFCCIILGAPKNQTRDKRIFAFIPLGLLSNLNGSFLNNK